MAILDVSVLGIRRCQGLYYARFALYICMETWQNSIFNIFSILNYYSISISIRPHTDIEYWWKPWLAEEAPIQSARSGYMLASRAVSRWIRFLARAIRYFHTLYSHSVISWKFRSWSFEMGVCYSEFFNPRERMNAYPFSVDFVYNRYQSFPLKVVLVYRVGFLKLLS